MKQRFQAKALEISVSDIYVWTENMGSALLYKDTEQQDPDPVRICSIWFGTENTESNNCLPSNP